jgi:hypothetical protein
MIITGSTLLAAALVMGMRGAFRASVKELFGAAVLAVLGLGCVLVGGLMAVRARKQERAGAQPAGATAGPLPAYPAYVIYLPVGAPPPPTS